MTKDKNVKERTHLCNLCNIEISVEQSKIVPSNMFREAVRKGLRPDNINAFAQSMKEVGMEIDTKVLGDGWVQFATANVTNWALCDVCAEKFERYMNI